jgi:pimeloyl-ACP methyl ester carboxylesterase
VLAVHGAGGGYDQGLLVAGNAFREGYQVIAPSRFGYLRTPVPQDVSPAAQADAHAALLDALGIRQAVVVGVSAGTPSAVEFALRYPNRTLALVLLVPAGYAPGHKVGLEPSAASQIVARIIVAGADFALWTAMHVTRSKVVRFLGVPPEIELRASPAEREQVTAIMRSVLPVSWRAAGVRIDMSTSYEPRPLEQIRAPTLVVSTHDDLFGTLPVARYLAKRISHARLVVYDTGGHLLVGRQAELCEAGRAFLKETSLNLAGGCLMGPSLRP